jgi:TatD DNase family protein
MELIDTHCHIHELDAALDSNDPTHALWRKADTRDPNKLLARAGQQGVTRMICVGTTAADSQRAIKFVQTRPACFASIGIHPHEAKVAKDAIALLEALVTEPKVVGVGECGLDYFYNHSNKQDQAKALRAQLELAITHNLPVIFHVREAFDDFWPIFDSYKNLRGVLHSYTDSRANLDKALERDLFIGVNGIMTFTKDQAQLATAKAIPLTKLLTETDAPFLTPAPFRGRVNEPAHVRLVAEFMANLRGEPLAELATQTSANAQTLFNLK